MGWLQDVPWFYVTVGTILSGAGMMTWLVQLDEWRSRNRVEHKLSLRNMKIQQTRVGEKVVAIRFGFDLHNTAAFPMKFVVDDLKTHLTHAAKNQTIFPPNREYTNDSVTIAPGGAGFFFDHNIVIPNDFTGPATAFLKCKLSYGRANRIDHKLEMNKNTISLCLAGDGNRSKELGLYNFLGYDITHAWPTSARDRRATNATS